MVLKYYTRATLCLAFISSSIIQTSHSSKPYIPSVHISQEERQAALKTLQSLYDRELTEADLHDKSAIAKALRRAIAPIHSDKTTGQTERLLALTSAKSTFENTSPDDLIWELNTMKSSASAASAASATKATASAASSTPFTPLPTFEELYIQKKDLMDKIIMYRIRLNKIVEDVKEALNGIHHDFFPKNYMDPSIFNEWKDRLYEKTISFHVAQEFEAQQELIHDTLRNIARANEVTDIQSLINQYFTKILNKLKEYPVLFDMAKRKASLLIESLDEHVRSSAHEAQAATGSMGASAAAAAAGPLSYDELHAQLLAEFAKKSKSLDILSQDQDFLHLFFNTYINNPSPASDVIEFNNLVTTPAIARATLHKITINLKQYRAERSKADSIFKEMITKQFLKGITPILEVVNQGIVPTKITTPEYILYVSHIVPIEKNPTDFCDENGYDITLLKSLLMQLRKK